MIDKKYSVTHNLETGEVTQKEYTPEEYALPEQQIAAAETESSQNNENN